MASINFGEIARVFQRQGLLKQFEEQEPLLIWHHVIGPNMSKMTNPLRVREEILYVQVQNNVVAQQLELLKDKVLEKLNDALSTTRIRDLRFRIGKVDRNLQNESSDDELMDIEQSELQSILEEIEDEALKSALEARIQYNYLLNKRREAEGYKLCTECNIYHEEKGDICYYCQAEKGL